MPTLYEILEINENATPEEIKQARDRLAKKWHPDKNNNSEEAKIKFQKIQEAYETLFNSQKRNEYSDLTGSAQEWLDKAYPKQQFTNQGSSTYTTLETGKRVYNDPAEETINPRLNFFSLNLSNKNLEGSLKLEGFANLKSLDLSGNGITSLDLEGCPNLRVIQCDNNPITSLKLINGNAKSFNPLTIKILLSQDKLVREKEVLSEQVSNLEEEKNSLDNQIAELKSMSERDRKLSEMQIGELKEEIKKQKKDLEDNYQVQINRLETKYNKEVQKNKVEFDRELGQERNRSDFLTNNKKILEKKLEEREIELQRLKQSSSTNEKLMQRDISSLRKEKNELELELASISKNYHSDLEQADAHSSSLKKQNSSLQEEIIQLKTQLESLKRQKLERQKSELIRSVANLKGKLNIEHRGKVDELLEAQEEVSKNSDSSYAQRQLKRIKESLVEKLNEEEINHILAKKEGVWKSQLELLNEPFKAMVDLEKEIDKQQKHFEKLFNSANDKLKKSRISINMKSLGKDDDYQAFLKEFLDLQALIVRSDDKQEICNYLLKRQSDLRQQISTKKKLDDKELEEIRLVKEELTKLERQKSILIINNSQQQYQSQVEVSSIPPKKF